MADRYKRLATPVSAVVMVGGVVTALLMPQTPDTTASGEKVIAFFHAHHTAMYVAAFSVSYAAAAAVLFFVSVAAYLRTRGSQVLAATTVVGGTVFASGALLGAGLLVAANDAPGRMTADVARTLNILQDDVFFLAVVAGLGICFLSIGVAGLRTKALPKWLGIVLLIEGAGWVVMQSAPYLRPGTDLGFLMVTGIGELGLFIWLAGWGTRLREPSP